MPKEKHDEKMKKLAENSQKREQNTLRCPYCNSSDVQKISTLSRAVSVSVVGLASSKIGKQWHCNNCKSDF